MSLLRIVCEVNNQGLEIGIFLPGFHYKYVVVTNCIYWNRDQQLGWLWRQRFKSSYFRLQNHTQYCKLGKVLATASQMQIKERGNIIGPASKGLKFRGSTCLNVIFSK